MTDPHTPRRLPRAYVLITLALFAFVGATRAAEPNALEKAILPIAEAHKGKIAVAVKNLASGESYQLRGDEVMPTASLIKIAVMIEAYQQAEDKKLKLDRTLTLKADDKVPGAGILTIHFSDGATFPLKDAIRLMMVYSDNTATNLVLDAVGIPAVNDRMGALGLKETKVNAKVYKGSTTSVDKARTDKYGLGSTTANETLKLLEMLHDGKVASAAACRTMLGHMEANDDKEMAVRYLPAGTVVAHKTGSVSKARTEAGIMYVPDPADKKKKIAVGFCVLTDGNEDVRWVIDNGAQVTIAKIAKAVYDAHANPDKK